MSAIVRRGRATRGSGPGLRGRRPGGGDGQRLANVHDGHRPHDPATQAQLDVGAHVPDADVALVLPCSHLRTHIVTLVAALAAALVGAWLFDETSLVAAFLIGVLAAAVTIAAVELLDRPAPTTSAPSRRAGACAGLGASAWRCRPVVVGERDAATGNDGRTRTTRDRWAPPSSTSSVGGSPPAQHDSSSAHVAAASSSSARRATNAAVESAPPGGCGRRAHRGHG